MILYSFVKQKSNTLFIFNFFPTFETDFFSRIKINDDKTLKKNYFSLKKVNFGN